MVFSSTIFLFVFLPLTILLYHLPFLKSIQSKNFVLLAASIVFYAWGEPFFVLVLLLSVVVNWASGLLIARYGKPALIAALVYDVGLLFVYKYLTFAVATVNQILGIESSRFSGIALPIGISFFTFQIISYIVDVYRKQVAVQKNPVNVALYIALFPQLIAGPIVRYNTIADQIMNRTVTADDLYCGVRRFIVGLGKKVLLANYMGMVADNLFSMTDTGLSVLSAWYGVLCYALQIYFDFSGYSDMAIGLGRLFGFHFEENFNYPYIAKSIVDFWHRWHISLSTWFRDYVYIPLGGNRVSRPRWLLNYFIVWMLTGIWHGANWTFLLWGFYYFALLTFERLSGLPQKLRWTYRLPTLLFILMGWVLFRSESLPLAWQYCRAMFTLGVNGFADPVFVNQFSGSFVVFIAAVIGATPLVRTLQSKVRLNAAVQSGVTQIALLAVFLLSVVVCVSNTYNPFIYFNF